MNCGQGKTGLLDLNTTPDNPKRKNNVSTDMPKKIGRYKIHRKIGQGGMGAVYLGEDPFIKRLVAIKTALLSNDPKSNDLDKLQKIFFNEVRSAGMLSHPHIVSIYDAFVEQDRFFLIMEYLGGESLDNFCQKETLLPVKQVTEIIFQCAKALDYAHQNGVIHRDIKAQNIILSKQGYAKISDFGIALSENSSHDIKSEELVGTIYYTAPELLRNKPFSPQTDIYALGVLSYELLTGTKPFQAETPISILYKISNEEPESIARYRNDMPEYLESIVMKAIQKDPEKRYKSCLQIASDLSSLSNNIKNLDHSINVEQKFNDLKKIDFFRDFTSNELAEVIRVSQWIAAKPNEKIIIEDSIDDGFFIIIRGEVIAKKNDKILCVIKQGECFGEMACVAKAKRAATIEATTGTFLMKINASSIDQMSVNAQLRFYRVFSLTLTQRLSSINEKFANAAVDLSG